MSPYFSCYLSLIRIFQRRWHTWIRRMNFRLRMNFLFPIFTIRWKRSWIIKLIISSISNFLLLLTFISVNKVIDSNMNNIPINSTDKRILFSFIILESFNIFLFIILMISFQYRLHLPRINLILLHMKASSMILMINTTFLH